MMQPCSRIENRSTRKRWTSWMTCSVGAGCRPQNPEASHKMKICEDASFVVAGQRIQTVLEEHMKSLGRVFNEQLSDKNQEAAIRKTTKDTIDISLLPGKFKVWLYQFVLLPRLLWPLSIYEIGLLAVQPLEGNIGGIVRQWLGHLQSSVALYSRGAKLKMLLKSIVEEYKIRKQLMFDNSTESVKPSLL